MISVLFLNPPANFWGVCSGLADVLSDSFETIVGSDYICISFDSLGVYDLNASEFRAKIGQLDYFKDLVKVCPKFIVVKTVGEAKELSINLEASELKMLSENQSAAFKDRLGIVLNKQLPSIDSYSIEEVRRNAMCAAPEPKQHPFNRFIGSPNARQQRKSNRNSRR